MDLAPTTPQFGVNSSFWEVIKAKHSQPYGSALTATFHITHAYRYYCMSVIYERTMKMNYDISLGQREWAKISNHLHQCGLHLVSKWRYSNKVNEEEYGFQVVTSESTVYTIVIEGQHALTTVYSSDATKMIEQLKDNTDFEVNKEVDTTTHSIEKWVSPLGEYFLLDYENIVGIQVIGITPELLYNEEVRMVTTLINKNNTEVELKFVIQWETDGVQTKGVIEEMCVNTPLPDIGSIQYLVEYAMGYYGEIKEPLIECYFDAKTESRSECTPDIIAKTREARLAARNEEE